VGTIDTTVFNCGITTGSTQYRGSISATLRESQGSAQRSQDG